MNAFDANWGPRSEMILSGNPNLLYKFLNKSWAIPSVVIILSHGIRITPFVRPWSTTTNIESNPSDNGRSIIKSIEQFANGWVDVASSTSKNAGFDGLWSILNCWQQPFPWALCAHGAGCLQPHSRQPPDPVWIKASCSIPSRINGPHSVWMCDAWEHPYRWRRD